MGPGRLAYHVGSMRLRSLTCALALALALATAWLGGCGASVEGGGGGDVDAAGTSRSDARTGGDAGGGIDALPCTGGDQRTTDSSGTCYEAFFGPLPWTAAQAACAARGGALASITSAAENTLVTGLIGTLDAFVGANDVMSEGTFTWASGEALVYTNWRAGEPNNANGTFEEDCMVVEGGRGGSWDDRPCDTMITAGAGAYRYVCER